MSPARLRFFLFAMFVSGFGNSLMPNIIAYSMLGSSNNSQQWFATVFLVGQVVPFLVTLSFARYIDRTGLYSKLLITQTVPALACLTYALFQYSFVSRIVLTLALQAVLSGLGAISLPAVTRSLAIIATDDNWLQEAARKAALYRSMAQLLGQGSSGLLMATLGAGPLVAINGFTFLAMVTAIFMNRHGYQGHDRTDADTSAPQKGGIFRPLMGKPLYRTVLLYQLCANCLVILPYLVFTPVLLARRLGIPEAAVRWGILGATFGLGAILGAIVVKRINLSNKLAVSVASGILELPILIVLAVAPTSYLLVPMAAVSGLQSAIARVLYSQQMFRDFPDTEVGRMTAIGNLTWIASSGVVAVSSLLIGSGHSAVLFLSLAVANVAMTVFFTYAVLRIQRKNGVYAA